MSATAWQSAFPKYFSSFPLLRDAVTLESIISSDIHRKNVKANDSVAFGTAYNIVCGKESRRAKPRFSKAHNAFFAEAFPCLPVLTASIGDILLTLPVQLRQNRRITAAVRTAQAMFTNPLLLLSIIIDSEE